MANLFRADLGDLFPFLSKLEQAGLRSEEFERIAGVQGAPYAEAMVGAYHKARQAEIDAAARVAHELLRGCGMALNCLPSDLSPEALMARHDDMPERVQYAECLAPQQSLIDLFTSTPARRGARLRELLLSMKSDWQDHQHGLYVAYGETPVKERVPYVQIRQGAPPIMGMLHLKERRNRTEQTFLAVIKNV